MTVRITDLDTGEVYIATSREQCQGLDAIAYDLALERGQAVLIGRTVAEPI